MTLKRGHGLDFLGGPMQRGTDPAHWVALKMEEGTTCRATWEPPKAGEGQGSILPLETPEGAQPCSHLAFSPARPTSAFHPVELQTNTFVLRWAVTFV